jgi:hypothetical protein
VLLPRGPAVIRDEAAPARSMATPILARDGGRLDPWNVRLGHVLCNRYDYGWRVRIRTMLEKGKSLEAIAEGLNRKGIRRPHGSPRWTAASVRQAFVS